MLPNKILHCCEDNVWLKKISVGGALNFWHEYVSEPPLEIRHGSLRDAANPKDGAGTSRNKHDYGLINLILQASHLCHGVIKSDVELCFFAMKE